MDPDRSSDPFSLAEELGSYNLKTFFTTPLSDTPWHPQGLIELATPAIQNPSLSLPNFPTFPTLLQEYRSAPLISENGTFPNDSGYGGSGPTIIESVCSIHEDDTPPIDAQQMDHLLTGFQIGHNRPLSASSLVPSQAAFSRSAHLAETKPYCLPCEKPLNTKAELNKHIQRHSKPYTCTYSGCDKAKQGCGFSTPNDLARHKRTVHKEHDRHGPVYVCTYEPCKSKKTKIWPRADNFRCHLSRQHSITLRAEDDLQGYIYRPPTAANRLDLQGIGQGLGPSGAETTDPNGQPPPHLQDSQVLDGQPDSSNTNAAKLIPWQYQLETALHSQQQTAPSCGRPFPLTGLGPPPDQALYGYRPGTIIGGIDGVFPPDLNDLLLGDDQSTAEMISEAFESPLLPEGDVITGDLTIPADYEYEIGRENGAWASQEPANDMNHSEDIDELSISPSDSGQMCHGSNGEFPTDDALVKSLNEARSDPSRLIAILKSLPSQFLESALKGDRGLEDKENKEDKEESDEVDEVHREDASSKANLKCPECEKSFARLCELKKHRKRHDRPYGCTFKYCTKAFGSKNDWKRHESNQHFTLETWTCDIPYCHKIRHRRETFKNHLLKDHHLGHDLEQVEERLERCRMGRHCDPRFWCGFCAQVIEIREANVNSWAIRCDHIDNHLFGKGRLEKKQMRDWVYFDDDEDSGDLSDDSDGDDLPIWTGKEGKRKAVDLLDTRRHKKPKEGILMWHCCNCPNATGLVHKMSPSCIECQHRKCGHCLEEMVMSTDERQRSAQGMDGL